MRGGRCRFQIFENEHDNWPIPHLTGSFLPRRAVALMGGVGGIRLQVLCTDHTLSLRYNTSHAYRRSLATDGEPLNAHIHGLRRSCGNHSSEAVSTSSPTASSSTSRPDRSAPTLMRIPVRLGSPSAAAASSSGRVSARVQNVREARTATPATWRGVSCPSPRCRLSSSTQLHRSVTAALISPASCSEASLAASGLGGKPSMSTYGRPATPAACMGAHATLLGR